MPTEISAHRLVESVVLRGEVGGVNKSGTASSTACLKRVTQSRQYKSSLKLYGPATIFNLVAMPLSGSGFYNDGT